MQFNSYLNFDGNCAEAFAFYARLFGGTIVHQSSFGEMPPGEGMPPIPESARSRIMHVHLQIKDQALMGSDAMPGADASCGGYQPAQGLCPVAFDVAELGHVSPPPPGFSDQRDQEGQDRGPPGSPYPKTSTQACSLESETDS